MILLVSPEQWANWDQWFNYTLPGYILILGTIFLFVGLIPFLCVRKKITYILFGVTTLVLVTFLGISYFKNKESTEYVRENHYLTAMVREYDAQIFSNKYYDPDEIESFKYIADINTPSHLPSIYKKIPVKQEVTYLGKNDYYAFVKLDNVVMKFSLSDCKKIPGSKAYFTGYHFKLRNKKFMKLGFIDLKHNLRDKVELPREFYNKKVSKNIEENYNHPGLVANWIPDSEK
ncbi:hypothetical protein CBF76_06595 [Lactobacillus taiwanensis]|uniref:hypothetical protein n=1 Tax=Lactobacillus taiwanensis TaxID=508451 RepID=UPI000B994759|nr:hypothetical protein [Lactobacillus taiwanensis]OYS19524.1 hypothetical protein CBF76_06595 [Lactobacillus taiwanensis]